MIDEELCNFNIILENKFNSKCKKINLNNKL